jgi:hypothetical protein
LTSAAVLRHRALVGKIMDPAKMDVSTRQLRQFTLKELGLPLAM